MGKPTRPVRRVGGYACTYRASRNIREESHAKPMECILARAETWDNQEFMFLYSQRVASTARTTTAMPHPFSSSPKTAAHEAGQTCVESPTGQAFPIHADVMACTSPPLLADDRADGANQGTYRSC